MRELTIREVSEIQNAIGGKGKGWWFAVAEYVYEMSTSFYEGFKEGANEPLTLAPDKPTGGGGGR
jgi:hypothetical protein